MHMVTHFSRNMRLKLVYHLVFSADESRLGVLQGDVEAGPCPSSALNRPSHPLHGIASSSSLAAPEHVQSASVHPSRPDSGRARPPTL